MTIRRIDLGDLVISGVNWAYGLDELVSEITTTWSAEQVAELAIVSHDTGGRLAATNLGRLGVQVTFNGSPWFISGVDTEFQNANVAWTFRCRSLLARKLRRTIKVSAEQKVAPHEWVTARVQQAGGRCIAQPTAKGGTIAQGNDQTTLDIIGDLASQLGYSWTQWGSAFVFGSRHWAWKTGVPGFPTYAATWAKNPQTDMLTATATQTEDDDITSATLDLTMPYPTGQMIRPWQRLRVTGLGRYDGTWLVDSVVRRPDGVTPVEITALQPKKIVVKSTGREGTE